MNHQPDIDVMAEQWKVIANILQRHVPDKEVWAFGSRAAHTAKQYSDLDLAIDSNDGLPLSLIAALEHDFSESNSPFKANITDWVTMSSTFRRLINSHLIQVK